MTQDKCQGCAVQQGTHVPMGAVIHPDDLAVDALAKAMKAKLAKKRAQGYGGWDTDCTQQRLSDLLRKHVDKGDPIDVANLCAFLLARGEGIAALQSAQAAPQAALAATHPTQQGLGTIEDPKEMARWLLARRSHLGSCRDAAEAWCEVSGAKSWDNYTALAAALAAQAKQGGA